MDITANKHGGNEFSNAANARLTDDIKAAMRTRVLNYIKSCGDLGAIADEVSKDLNMLMSTVSARMTELKALEAIYYTGQRRPTRSGYSAGVWRA